MTYALYDASVLVAKDVLGSLSAIIAKAEASSAAASIPAARIHADMLPFAFQVFVVSATAHKLVARATGAEPKDYENKLETFADMKALIADVKAQVDAADRDTVNSRSNEIVSVGMGKDKPDAKMETWEYVNGYVMPNLYFHLATAYNIARKEGVEIGKMDYLQPFIQKYVQG